jgi:hypothetical protein
VGWVREEFATVPRLSSPTRHTSARKKMSGRSARDDREGEQECRS